MLHFADLHLDTPSRWADREQARKRWQAADRIALGEAYQASGYVVGDECTLRKRAESYEVKLAFESYTSPLPCVASAISKPTRTDDPSGGRQNLWDMKLAPLRRAALARFLR